MGLKSYIKAARLRTLPLSISGIIVGSILGNDAINANLTAAVAAPFWANSIFWLAILTTIGFQVLSNFANDYGMVLKERMTIAKEKLEWFPQAPSHQSK